MTICSFISVYNGIKAVTKSYLARLLVAVGYMGTVGTEVFYSSRVALNTFVCSQSMYVNSLAGISSSSTAMVYGGTRGHQLLYDDLQAHCEPNKATPLAIKISLGVEFFAKSLESWYFFSVLLSNNVWAQSVMALVLPICIISASSYKFSKTTENYDQFKQSLRAGDLNYKSLVLVGLVAGMGAFFRASRHFWFMGNSLAYCLGSIFDKDVEDWCWPINSVALGVACMAFMNNLVAKTYQVHKRLLTIDELPKELRDLGRWQLALMSLPCVVELASTYLGTAESIKQFFTRLNVTTSKTAKLVGEVLGPFELANTGVFDVLPTCKRCSCRQPSVANNEYAMFGYELSNLGRHDDSARQSDELAHAPLIEA